MRKEELASKLAEQTNMSKNAAAGIINKVFDLLAEDLVANGETSLPGLGTLKVAQRDARTGLNPRTGEKIALPAKKRAKFVASTAIKKALNS